MITDRDAGRAIRDWLEEDPPILPAHVFEAVIAEIPQVPQRRRRLPFGRADQAWPRWFVAATIALLVLATAATLVAGALGWLRAHPTPRPLPAQEMSLEAGSYVVDGPFPVRFSLDVPDGWAAVESTPTSVTVRRDRPDGPQLILTTVEGVYADPCRPEDGLIDGVGRSVEDLAAALAGLPGLGASGPTAVTLGGHAASEVRLRAPAEARDCRVGDVAFPVWGLPEMFGVPPGGRWEVGVVEVDGVRLVVVAEFLAGTTSADEDGLDLVRRSIRFGEEAAIVAPGVAAPSPPTRTEAPEPPVQPIRVGRLVEGPAAFLAVQLFEAGSNGRTIPVPFRHALVVPGSTRWFGTSHGIASSDQGPAPAMLDVWAIAAFHPDPCRWKSSLGPVPVADLDALAATLASGWEIGSPAAPTTTAVTDPPWNSRQAREFELAIPADLDPDRLRWWRSPPVGGLRRSGTHGATGREDAPSFGRPGSGARRAGHGVRAGRLPVRDPDALRHRGFHVDRRPLSSAHPTGTASQPSFGEGDGTIAATS